MNGENDFQPLVKLYFLEGKGRMEDSIKAASNYSRIVFPSSRKKNSRFRLSLSRTAKTWDVRRERHKERMRRKRG